LLFENGVTHVRRICLSLVVYIALMYLLVVAPMWLLRRIVDACGFQHMLTIRTRYILPEIQLPVELAIGHITFLTVLDKKKNIIGRVLFHWLVVLCDALGLTRMLLPVQMGKSVFARWNLAGRMEHANLAAMGVGPAGPGAAGELWGGPAPAPAAGGAEPEPLHVLHEKHELRGEWIRNARGEILGRVLRRPPPGWDARNLRNTTRWAWGGEEATDLERSVAPRVAPSWWLPRLAVALSLSWLLVVAVILSLTALPLLAGRAFFWLLVPAWSVHDPVSFVCGVAICGACVALMRRVSFRSVRGLARALYNIPEVPRFPCPPSSVLLFGLPLRSPRRRLPPLSALASPPPRL